MSDVTFVCFIVDKINCFKWNNDYNILNIILSNVRDLWSSQYISSLQLTNLQQIGLSLPSYYVRYLMQRLCNDRRYKNNTCFDELEEENSLLLVVYGKEEDYRL